MKRVPITYSTKIIIAIDGYSSCGKSTTAKQVAARLGYTYIDTGAMYRAVTLHFLQRRVELTNPEAVTSALDSLHIAFSFNPETACNETYLNGVNVENEIRKLYVANLVPEVSAIREVRRAMVTQQQAMGRKGGIVMDGRDIGTHVFPEAELKVFMTADPIIRAERRQIELWAKGEAVELHEIAENIKKRDHLDTTRTESPLRRADDAQLLDTSFFTIDEQVDWVIRAYKAKLESPVESQRADFQYAGKQVGREKLPEAIEQPA
ncbi:(d)CMP kinase [Larkinella rosea]|uniref:Cytidylate kinase n=1 Tax=Larkinella rosea TaxID=2025312 RepID=A0A3P1BT33_9BACT|nr:(d)CMP kinase [Larkinella rosea]RRB04217.1 (d)CMP kinase [Larkinella rosea]